MLIGKILWWDSKDQNGIIKSADGTKYYFDASVAKTIRADKLKAKTLVVFESNPAIRSCLCAKNVRTPTAKALKSVKRKFLEAQQLELGATAGAA